MMGMNKGMFSGGMGGYGGSGWAGGKYENFRGGGQFMGNQPQGFGGFGGGINVAPAPGSGLGFTNWKPPMGQPQTGGELPPYSGGEPGGYGTQTPMAPGNTPPPSRGHEGNPNYGGPQAMEPWLGGGQGGGVPGMTVPGTAFGGSPFSGTPTYHQGSMGQSGPMRPRNFGGMSLIGGNPYQNPWR